MASAAEAHYLCAILNAAKFTELARPLMSYGKDERHFDKNIWQLPVPQYEPVNDLHARLSARGVELEAAVAALSLDTNRRHFAAVQRDVREFLACFDASKDVEELVEELLLTVRLTTTSLQVEFGSPPAAVEDGGLGGGSFQDGLDGAVEFVRVVGGEVAQGRPLQVGPEVFDRGEVGGVGGERFESQPGVVGADGADVGSFVAVPAVPGHDHPSAEVAEQVAEEVGDGRPGEGAVDKGAEVEAESAASGRAGEGGDDRHLLPVPAADEEAGRSAAGRQGAADQGGEHHAAFVDEDNGGPLAARPFCRRGQSCVRHRSMAARSASRATRCSFCGVMPRSASQPLR